MPCDRTMECHERPTTPEENIDDGNNFSSLREMWERDVNMKKQRNGAEMSPFLWKPLKLSLMDTSFSLGDALAINPQ